MPKSYKYIEWILRRRSFSDFLKAVNYKVDMKEWTECVGMLERIKTMFVPGNPPDVFFDIGCGKRPTLGALFALNINNTRSKTSIICIDPQLDTSCASDISNVALYKQSIADYCNILNDSVKKDMTAIIACNHAHIKYKDLIPLFNRYPKHAYITCPCCADNRPHQAYYYKDRHVWSPKNGYYIYKFDEYGQM